MGHVGATASPQRRAPDHPQSGSRSVTGSDEQNGNLLDVTGQEVGHAAAAVEAARLQEAAMHYSTQGKDGCMKTSCTDTQHEATLAQQLNDLELGIELLLDDVEPAPNDGTQV